MQQACICAYSKLSRSIRECQGCTLTCSSAGASVIYADTVADLGYADELGNYAEYSGAPNQQVESQKLHTVGASAA